MPSQTTESPENPGRFKAMVGTWLPELQKSPLAPHVKAHLASGHEEIRVVTTGSVISLVAGTAKAGHGQTLDAAVVDEAWSFVDGRMEQGLLPTLATRPNPQYLVVSTAGTPDASPYLLRRVEQGRQLAEAGVTEGTAYVEYSADPDADPSDPATWRSANPAMGLTISETAIRAEFESMDLNEFRRARLNQWTVALTEPVIPLTTWNALTDPDSEPADEGLVLAVDLSPDRSHASIACGSKLPNGRVHVEVIAAEPGTSWIPQKLRRLVDRHNPTAVLVDRAGPGDSLTPLLEERGITVTEVLGHDVAQACGLFYDAVMSGVVVHLDQPELSAAIAGATKRQLGDAWAWNRRSSSVDISPLVAVTLAYWHASTITRGVGIWDLNEVVAQMQQKQYDGEFTLSTMPPPPPPPFQSGFLIDRAPDHGISLELPDYPQQ